MLLPRILVSTLASLLISGSACAGKLALVIDDFGYRPKEENQILKLPVAISVAVLPDAPLATQMATRAHQQGREVLIHLPMAPLSKQPLEKDTLRPDMSLDEIRRIIHNASLKVPYAIGLNNHMGSAMTSSLSGMQKVMQVLDHYNYYFLDSMTIGNSQASQAATGTRVRVIKRRVFLDDSPDEAAIRQQFTRAVRLAQRDGWAIAIGHPHPNTVRVLQQMLTTLPGDITLVRPSQLLNDAQRLKPPPHSGAAPHDRFTGGQICRLRQPLPAVPPSRALAVVSESVAASALVQNVKACFSGLHPDFSSLK
ncbi:hypothetical protein BL250_11690 [Erwinia sp. OLTSP20]|uniref:divergent polysaccharide deacetylase family protein n=1 Tax=unclassified Erwinia TaxID=2622719 RepID=UPI000C17E3C6|nr:MULTISPECIES: divergent polysaccharide deacetylase family protein [unclassified Erwinia]PIJ49667.1 hypothetical protein BV501_11950 [Erwinia sp. OAMSP11]PIJ70082.1 hypothetical protein BK416_13650 [Erwinia sp. OLSSP12]PIJ80579.1 hypothetical protein BLD47_10915 [Erwinia sp. OLCASP19]PIJ82744.1 hypothetical protein BLD46_10665 [Erwinia sp. OLMTSP26]PIJ84821.1 hypothetical protein BLD49_11860 [Erwinia sp. OLMDSP33]